MMDKAKGLAALRILLGAGFLYAGLEKVFDFAGSGEPFTSAGFLQFGTNGSLPGSDPNAIVNPTHDLWVSLAGSPGLVSVINSLVVIGEVAIGVALILGIATRFAGVMGALLMGFITVAAWSFAFGPVNETMLYAAVALYLAYAQAGLAYGLDAIIEKTEIVTHRPALHYLLG
jgi:thiosulfate dehydrogenase [quinone] large subunit